MSPSTEPETSPTESRTVTGSLANSHGDLLQVRFDKDIYLDVGTAIWVKFPLFWFRRAFHVFCWVNFLFLFHRKWEPFTCYLTPTSDMVMGHQVLFNQQQCHWMLFPKTTNHTAGEPIHFTTKNNKSHIWWEGEIMTRIWQWMKSKVPFSCETRIKSKLNRTNEKLILWSYIIAYTMMYDPGKDIDPGP